MTAWDTGLKASTTQAGFVPKKAATSRDTEASVPALHPIKIDPSFVFLAKGYEAANFLHHSAKDSWSAIANSAFGTSLEGTCCRDLKLRKSASD